MAGRLLERWVRAVMGAPVPWAIGALIVMAAGAWQASTIRLDDGRTPKGYRLEQFGEAFTSYIPADPPLQPPHRHNPQISTGFDDAQPPQQNIPDAVAIPREPAESQRCGGVAVENQDDGADNNLWGLDL